jgi:hypothetical protein
MDHVWKQQITIFMDPQAARPKLCERWDLYLQVPAAMPQRLQPGGGEIMVHG